MTEKGEYDEDIIFVLPGEDDKAWRTAVQVPAHGVPDAWRLHGYNGTAAGQGEGAERRDAAAL